MCGFVVVFLTFSRSILHLAGFAPGRSAGCRLHAVPRAVGHVSSVSQRVAAIAAEAAQFFAVRQQADGQSTGKDFFLVAAR